MPTIGQDISNRAARASLKHALDLARREAQADAAVKFSGHLDRMATAMVNGHRLSSIRLENDDTTITWLAKNPLTGKSVAMTPAQRQIDAAYPELSAGLHLPKFARVEAHAEGVSSGDLADPFRPRYAVDLQLLDADGKPAKNTPIYPAVPLPLPMAGQDSGMFQFPPVGTLVEVAFTDGRPDKPFIRQTLAQGNTLPDVKPGEQLQQQRGGSLPASYPGRRLGAENRPGDP
ncbi:Rhs element Vgr protein [Serratia odorifera]|uniref:Rhs element Vgr protein n=1 Tax=Serratia odorifera TaxID=618 RepID=A0A3S4HTN7_SEROD|nr:Rhs element Vgr protein [Serratia odorifera]